MQPIFQDRRAHERITRLEQAFVSMDKHFQLVAAQGMGLAGALEGIRQQQEATRRQLSNALARSEAERIAAVAALIGRTDPGMVFDVAHEAFRLEHPGDYMPEAWATPPGWLATIRTTRV